MVDPSRADGTPTLLTRRGRQLLEERTRTLERRLVELRHELDERDRSAEVVREHLRAQLELEEITTLLSEAGTAEEMPADSRLVELGDTVMVRVHGATEQYVIVHAREAAVDDGRISAESPLGRALLHRWVGESIEVTAPSGSYSCTILSATRSWRDTPAGT